MVHPNFQGYSCTAVPVAVRCGPEVALLYIFTDLRLQYAWVLGDGPRCHNSYVSRFSDPASLSNVERCRPSHERAARTHDTVLYPYAAAEPPRSSSAVPSAAAIAHTRTRAMQARPQAAASSPNERDAEQHTPQVRVTPRALAPEHRRDLPPACRLHPALEDQRTRPHQVALSPCL